MWGRCVITGLYLLLTYVSIKDAIDFRKGQFEWYTKAWGIITLLAMLIISIIYF